MSGAGYRTRMDMGYDVLKVISESAAISPAILSHVSSRANLSHKITVEIINIFGAASLIDIDESRYRGSPIFRVTGDGRKFMRDYESLHSYMEPKKEFDYRKIVKDDAK